MLLGAVPNTADVSALMGAVAAEVPEAEITCLSSGREQHCLEVICHRSREDKVLEILRSYGFSFTPMKDLTGTAQENIRRLEAEKAGQAEKKAGELKALRDLGGRKRELDVALDRVQQVIATEEAKERLAKGAGQHGGK